MARAVCAPFRPRARLMIYFPGRCRELAPAEGIDSLALTSVLCTQGGVVCFPSVQGNAFSGSIWTPRYIEEFHERAEVRSPTRAFKVPHSNARACARFCIARAAPARRCSPARFASSRRRGAPFLPPPPCAACWPTYRASGVCTYVNGRGALPRGVKCNSRVRIYMCTHVYRYIRAGGVLLF